MPPTKPNFGAESPEDIKDFFPEDQAVVQASTRIRRILYRRREKQIAQWSPVRRYLHILFYEPSSMRARIFIGVSTAVVLLFLIVFIIDTFPQYRVQSHWRDIARSVNLATALFFAVEWVLRLYAFQRPLMHHPWVLYFTNDSANFLGKAKWLRALQILRVLRVLRLTEYSVELYVTIRTLRKSLLQILVVMTIIIILLLTACFLLFFAENNRLDPSPYQNIFYCLYWGFVTITTVGYGDYTPVSPWGHVTMFMGVFTIVFPTSIISNNFAAEWEAFHKAQKVHDQRLLLYEYEYKRHDLARVWNYANQAYDMADRSDDTDRLS
ncbi:hypothetical protein BX661DRAFT_183089, partial [Kickxella alabastrina]|uniref:uncharacterized protein n=1 Tax=Kickxella alabastrina TaxID=61397 RepID=UPI00221FEEDA